MLPPTALAGLSSVLTRLFLAARLPSAAADQSLPTAVRKMGLDPGEKFLPHYAAFSPSLLSLGQNVLMPEDEDAAEAIPIAGAVVGYVSGDDIVGDVARIVSGDYTHDDNGTCQYRRPFGLHLDDDPGAPSWAGVLRRGGSVGLARRQACPAGMSGCDSVGAPNRCCVEGTYCATVDNPDLDNVACCPQGATCGGTVGGCPDSAVSCPTELGGGCCIPGYVCFGVGCIPSPAVETPSATPSTITTTVLSTISDDSTPSTIIVTVTQVITPSLPPPTTRTTTEVVTSDTDSDAGTGTDSSTNGNAPWRPTLTSSGDSGATPSTDPDDTTYCPAGFYGCLARHGGGCCRTDRACETESCPPTAWTNIITAPGLTIAVPATDVPDPGPTCAAGWFLCGDEGGPVPGCCPQGYQCDTVSCTAQAQATVKMQPGEVEGGWGGAGEAPDGLLLAAAMGVLSWLLLGA